MSACGFDIDNVVAFIAVDVGAAGVGAFNRECVIGFTQPKLQGFYFSVVNAIFACGNPGFVITGSDSEVAFPELTLRDKDVGVSAGKHINVVGVRQSFIVVVWIKNG